MYLVCYIRSDLAYPVSYLSQFIAAPCKSHYTATRDLPWYRRGTIDLKLSGPPLDASEMTLAGYSDSDYENCQDTRHSISGNLVQPNYSTIC
jgi:hypothetical protein